LIGARSSKLTVVLSIAVAGLALAVRLCGLRRQSLTMDEVRELALARQSISDLALRADGFPPLYQILLKGWLAVLGPEAGRSFSVLCGMLIVAVVWRLGRLVGGVSTGWAAALLVAISPIHVWYAQEARANALFYLLAVLSIWLFLSAMHRTRGRDWAWYALSAIAGLYVHYYFALVILGLLVTVPFYPDPRHRLATLARVHAVIALAALPWVWFLLPDLALQSGYAAPHVPLDLKSLGYTLLTYVFGFSVGPSIRDLHLPRTGSTLLEALPWGLAATTVCLLLARPLWQSRN
jgi:hypothetical protein